MKIKKILNNNAAIVMDGQEEKIAIGSGIAFNKRKNDVISLSKVKRLFVMEEKEKFQQLLLQIPEAHFAISEQIILYAEKMIGTKLNEHIHISLTDHLSFAIERVKEGIHLENKLLNEIKVLYQTEFKIGLWALKLIAEQLHIEMPIDEAAYIALHIHTAKMQTKDMHETIRQTSIMRDIVELIKTDLKMTFADDDIAYQRLITHLRYVISRIDTHELHTLDEEMLEMIKKKFPDSFRCSEEVSSLLQLKYEQKLPAAELGYIALHIERLRQRRKALSNRGSDQSGV